jgi:thioredoxin-related protein
MQHPLASFATDITNSDWSDAIAKSREAGKPALVLFSTTSCPYCRRLESDVLTRDDVKAELKAHYMFYTVDLSCMTQDVADHASRLGINGVPLMIRYDASGRETARANFMDAKSMMEWLEDGE